MNITYAYTRKKPRSYMTEGIRKLMEYVIPIYNQLDNGHKFDHVQEVLKCADEIATTHVKITDPRLLDTIRVAALLHDIGLAFGPRKDHHVSGSNWVHENSNTILNIIDVDIYLVGMAVLEHRASYKGEFTSIVSEIISAADRQKPSEDPISIHDRSYHYARSRGYDHDEAVEHAVSHIKDKYGDNGYAYGNRLFREVYQIQITRFQNRLRALTDEEITNYLDTKFGGKRR